MPVMTRAEAQEMLDWARLQPDIVKAYGDPTHPAYAELQLQAQRLYYWLHKHPQTADGRPVPVEQLPGCAPRPEQEQTQLDALDEVAWLRLGHALEGPGGAY